MRQLKCLAVFVVAAGLAAGTGCASRHEEGVKSNLHTQWTQVNADTKAATEAAEAVLDGEGLKDVKSNATNVDGQASGTMADGKKVTISVEKKSESTSQVSVNVGKLGDPKLGAELARKVKMRAEGQ
jgi:hypothetical protein